MDRTKKRERYINDFGGAEMNELWDVYDFDDQQNLVKTGEIIPKGDVFPEHGFHLVAQVWIRNAQEEYLISQRSKEKKHAFYWEMTGGGAQSGETSLQAACREVKEELGIFLHPEQGRFCFQGINRFPKRKDVVHVWMFENITVDPQKLVLQEKEVNAAMWASKAVIYALLETGLWMPWTQFNYLPEFLGAKEERTKEQIDQIQKASYWLINHRNEEQGKILLNYSIRER